MRTMPLLALSTFFTLLNLSRVIPAQAGTCSYVFGVAENLASDGKYIFECFAFNLSLYFLSWHKKYQKSQARMILRHIRAHALIRLRCYCGERLFSPDDRSKSRTKCPLEKTASFHLHVFPTFFKLLNLSYVIAAAMKEGRDLLFRYHKVGFARPLARHPWKPGSHS